MAVTVDKLTSALVRTGPGPLYTVVDAAVSDPLDGIGSLDITLPATDERTALITANTLNYLRIVPDGDTADLTRVGLVTERAVTSDGAELDVAALSLAQELTHTTVGVLELSDGAGGPMAAADLLDAILDGTGWTSDGTPSRDVYHQFGDETPFAALVKLAELTGDHFRLSDTVAREIEWLPTTAGGFVPADSGLRAVDAADPAAVETNDAVCLIVGGLSVVHDATSRLTKLYPRGAGNAAARLYLNHTTRFGAPGTGVDGDYVSGAFTLHIDEDRPDLSYIKHTANDAAGSIGAVESFRDTAEIGTTATDTTSAANELFDRALTSLKRRLEEQTAYRLTVTKVRSSLRPGMSIRLICRHFVDGFGWLDVDEDVLILEATTAYGEGEPDVALTVTQLAVDRWPTTGTQQLVRAVEQVQAAAANVQTAERALSSATVTTGTDLDLGAVEADQITLGPGTATAGTAPLYLTSGTLLGTPEPGAMEFDGTHLYFTTSGGRVQLT